MSSWAGWIVSERRGTARPRVVRVRSRLLALRRWRRLWTRLAGPKAAGVVGRLYCPHSCLHAMAWRTEAGERELHCVDTCEVCAHLGSQVTTADGRR